jgi:cytochrome P450
MDKKLKFVIRYNYLFYTFLGEINSELELYNKVVDEFIESKLMDKYDEKTWVFSSLMDMNDYENEMSISEDKEFMDGINGVYRYFENIIAPRKLLILSKDKCNKDLIESIKYLLNMMSKEVSSDGILNIRDSLLSNLGGNK